MASHLVIEAADVSKRGLRDAAAHRQGVAPVYNAYARVSGDPAFAGRQGDYQALLRPLFMLSFLVDDYLAENAFFGARRVLLSSASSKTAFGLAHLLHTLRKPVQVIGLTSAGNTAFVESLGCYDDVVTYDRVTSLPLGFAGRLCGHGGQQRVARDAAPAFRRRDEIFRPDRSHPSRRLRREGALPGAKPSWFFAPDQIRKRAKEWGPGGVDAQVRRGMVGIRPEAGPVAHRDRRPRADAVPQVYLDTLNGRVPPDQGHILSLAE